MHACVMKFRHPFLSLLTVMAAVSWPLLAGCTSDLVTRLKTEAGGEPDVVLLGKGKKVVMNYALRRTRLQVQLKFDVVKITKMTKVPGGADKPAEDPPKYQVWPNSDGITCTIDYINDPQLKFEVLADERKKAFLGADESFSYDEAGRLTGISTTYEGKAAETVKAVISAAFNSASLAKSVGLFGNDPSYEKREVLDGKVVVKKTIFPESLSTSRNSYDYPISFITDITSAVDLFKRTQNIGTETVTLEFVDVSLNLSTKPRRIASSRSLRAKIEKASKAGVLTGLPVRPEAPSATLSFVLIYGSGEKAQELAKQEIAMPELADITFLPFPSNPWRSKLTTSLELQANGAIKKYGRITSSAAADTAALVNSVATDLNTDIPKLTKQIADAKKSEASLRLKILTEETTIKQKEADLKSKIAAAAALNPGPEKTRAEADIEIAKSQLAIEREKLNYLKQGLDVSS